MWMKTARLQRVVGRSRVLRRTAIAFLSALETLAMRGHKPRDVLALLQRSRSGHESLLTANEAFTIFGIARAQAALDGEMAEVGVYQGTSAAIIAAAAPRRTVHLFDTFTGLPEPAEGERAVFRKGQFEANLVGVRRRLRGCNVEFHVGEFPASASGLNGCRFSFVHLDVDLYTSTLAGLSFFYPRMVSGGIILSHDYSMLPGVERAFAEFMRDRPERPIELPSTQAMIVCLGGNREAEIP